MDRREPPSLKLPEPQARPIAGVDAPPRLRSLRDADVRAGRRGRSRLVTALFYLLLGGGCIAAALASFLLVAAPTELVRDQIAAEVKARTGRTLTFNGATSVSLFPTVGVRLDGVSLSAGPGMEKAPPLVVMKRLTVDVRLLPLLQREIVVDRLVLSDPVFELVVDGDGRRSWDFAAAEDARPTTPIRLAQAAQRGSRNDALPPELNDFVRNASDPTQAGQRAGRPLAGLDQLVLADMHVENGTVHFTDQRNGTHQEIAGIAAEIGLKSVASPLTANGTLRWHGETLAFTSRLQTLKAVLENRAATLNATLAGAPIELSYEGTLTQKSAPETEGRLSVKTGSARELARWLGTELQPSSGFGPASLSGIVRASSGVASLDAAVLTLDGASANGSISVEAVGARPMVKANLRLADVDLDQYRRTAGTVPTPAGPPPTTIRPAAPAAPRDKAPRSIEDLLGHGDGTDNAPKAAGPRVHGFTQRDGWSSDTLDLSSLGLFDADAKVTVTNLTGNGLRIGASQLAATLKAGTLRLTIEDAQLYDGRASGFITMETARPALLGTNLQLTGVSALPLLKDSAGLDWLAGKGRLSLALAGHGLSEREIVESLQGRVDFNVDNGELIGWNIPQMIRGLGQGKFSGFERVPSEKTDFSEMAGTFQVTSGIATNQDLRLIGPLLRVTGSGTIELPARRLDYTVRPKLVASSTGQNGQPTGPDAGGLEIPIRIQGPWDRPKYAPDLQGVLRDPDKAVDTINQIGKQLGVKGNLGDAVRRALGGGPSTDSKEEGQAPKPGLGQLLDQILKR